MQMLYHDELVKILLLNAWIYMGIYEMEKVDISGGEKYYGKISIIYGKFSIESASYCTGNPGSDLTGIEEPHIGIGIILSEASIRL